MKITFTDKIPIKDTMAFELLFEEELRLDVQEKSELLEDCHVTWLLIDGKLAGEAYSIYLKQLIRDEKYDEGIPDIDDERYLSENSVYLYSLGVLPKFLNQGLGSILFSQHLGLLKGLGYSLLIAHATSENMEKIACKFGSEFMQDGVHENWFGTTRTAKLFELRLNKSHPYKQPDDYSCGVYAMKYLLDRAGKDIPTHCLRSELNPSKDTGTDCESITKFLDKHNIKYSSTNPPGHAFHLTEHPMLVRYYSEGVEHYSVMTGCSVSDGTVTLFDPWIGNERTMPEKDFIANWKSNKYGDRWGLAI